LWTRHGDPGVSAVYIHQPMGDTGVHAIGRGLPETVLAPEPDEVVQAIQAATALEGEARREALAAVAARWPKSLVAWALLGESARDDTEAYAYFRVGYHRGLDALRASGWRGSGYVRWSHPENHGFLGALDGLRRIADRIGEHEEAARCAEFLKQLDRKWRPGEDERTGEQG
jgi:hypothetical protein